MWNVLKAIFVGWSPSTMNELGTGQAFVWLIGFSIRNAYKVGFVKKKSSEFFWGYSKNCKIPARHRNKTRNRPILRKRNKLSSLGPGNSLFSTPKKKGDPPKKKHHHSLTLKNGRQQQSSSMIFRRPEMPFKFTKRKVTFSFSVDNLSISDAAGPQAGQKFA